MTTVNRVNGLVRAATGAGVLAAGLVTAPVSAWLALPAVVWGGWKLGTGAAQLLTGWSDEAE